MKVRFRTTELTRSGLRSSTGQTGRKGVRDTGLSSPCQRRTVLDGSLQSQGFGGGPVTIRWGRFRMSTARSSQGSEAKKRDRSRQDRGVQGVVLEGGGHKDVIFDMHTVTPFTSAAGGRRMGGWPLSCPTSLIADPDRGSPLSHVSMVLFLGCVRTEAVSLSHTHPSSTRVNHYMVLAVLPYGRQAGYAYVSRELGRRIGICRDYSENQATGCRSSGSCRCILGAVGPIGGLGAFTSEVTRHVAAIMGVSHCLSMNTRGWLSPVCQGQFDV